MAIITISRGTFSGGQALANCLGERLGYSCITREDLLVEAAKQFNVPRDMLDTALATKPTFWERFRLRKTHYVSCVRATLVRLVSEERSIYSGLAGHLLLKEAPHVLRVKVIADMEYRIKAAMERNHFTSGEAIEYINEMDDSRNKWVNFFYHVDRKDPSGYDLVINLEYMSLATACVAVAAVAKHEEFLPTADSQKRMEDLVLAADIRARIALDRHISDRDLIVDAHDGVIEVRGTLDTEIEADTIRNLVRTFPGVRDVATHLRIKSP